MRTNEITSPVPGYYGFASSLFPFSNAQEAIRGAEHALSFLQDDVDYGDRATRFLKATVRFAGAFLNDWDFNSVEAESVRGMVSLWDDLGV